MEKRIINSDKPLVSLKILPLGLMISVLVFFTFVIIISVIIRCLLGFFKIHVAFLTLFSNVLALLFLFFIIMGVLTIIYFVKKHKA